MDFDFAVKTINRLLREKRPVTFNSSWIKHALNVYQYIQKNVRAEIGGIDWDRVTRALDRRFHRKWKPAYHYRSIAYSKKEEVGLILDKYRANLYAFVSPADKNDEYVRDIICIALVRIAQKGNILAKEEIVKLARLAIDDWIETSPTHSSWEGHESLIEKRIEACIRCYRYSGTFVGYLFKTLQYAGRGLISTCSIHDYLK